MKSPTTKVVVVKINEKKGQVTVDAAVFDDIFIEAATRFVEKQKGDPIFFNKIRVLGYAYVKEDEENLEMHQQINMYHILMNAAMYKVADLLREKTKNLHNIDLRVEPARANAGKSRDDQ